jgi:hypothetical protein
MWKKSLAKEEILSLKQMLNLMMHFYYFGSDD